MRAVTIEPGRPHSLALQDVADPIRDQGAVLVRTIAIGVCGTDRELIEGVYGEAPRGRDRLVLGHESLGRVLAAPAGSGYAAGDLVVGVVRHPDPVPCAYCAVGEWDMCRNGRYTERGIKQADGFSAERWLADPGFLVKVSPALGLAGVLLEPTSVVAKAWEHIERISARSRRAPQRALVTGGGPVGLMAALIGIQRGLEVHLLDHNENGPKPRLAHELGVPYHLGFPSIAPDLVIECTGSPAIVAQALARSAPGGIVCLTGLSGSRHGPCLDVAALNQSMVLENRVVFGTVNANLRHYRAAAAALACADRAWLGRIINRRVPLEHWKEAYEKRRDDVKTVLLYED
jgi:threonine dehydrogenase-like Zn-dependent dehydrogenase